MFFKLSQPTVSFDKKSPIQMKIGEEHLSWGLARRCSSWFLAKIFGLIGLFFTKNQQKKHMWSSPPPPPLPPRPLTTCRLGPMLYRRPLKKLARWRNFASLQFTRLLAFCIVIYYSKFGKQKKQMSPLHTTANDLQKHLSNINRLGRLFSNMSSLIYIKNLVNGCVITCNS